MADLLFKKFLVIGYLLVFISIKGISQNYIIKYAPLKPSPKDTISKNYGYLPLPLLLPKTIKKKDNSIEEFPDYYNLKDEGLISSVKDQGYDGTCWAFGTIGVIESNLLQEGYPEYDLSEENMATCHSFVYQKDKGGNSLMATSYLSTHKGPIDEEDDPYYYYPGISSCKVSGKEPLFYIDNIYWISKYTENLKKLILEYGSIAVSMHYDDLYFNPVENTYCYLDTFPENHMVIIVGWDDNKPVTYYKDRKLVTLKGAWIVKNSWGKSWGDRGYFYVSYDDTRFANTGLVIPEIKEYPNYDNIIFYDEVGVISSIGYSESDGNTVRPVQHGYGISHFKVKGKQQLLQIGTYALMPNTLINIQIYKLFNGKQTTGLLYNESDIKCEFAGYHTFPVNAIVDDDFYVKIKYYTYGFDYPIPVEMYNKDFANPNINNKVSWISGDSKIWEAVGSDAKNKVDLCIRAYLNNSFPIYDELSDDNPPFTIYPNPVNDFLNIEVNFMTTDDIEITLYNINGNKIALKTYNQKNDEKLISFDVSLLSKGMYFLVCTNLKFIHYSKFIKV